jgi:hypothetical protein
LVVEVQAELVKDVLLAVEELEVLELEQLYQVLHL